MLPMTGSILLFLIFNGTGFSIRGFQRKPLELRHTPAQRQVNWIRIQLANYSSAVLKQKKHQGEMMWRIRGVRMHLRF
jgi:hypothetical protein